MYDAVTGQARKPIVALDLDGVLHSYSSGYTGPAPLDPPVHGAQAFCQELLDRGYKIKILTTRAHPDLQRKDQAFVEIVDRQPDGAWVSRQNKGLSLAIYVTRQWLRHHGFPQEVCDCEITHKKEHFDVLIDDRALRFDGVFEDMLAFLDKNPKAQPWHGSQ